MALSTVVRRFWRSIPGGTGVNSVSISLKKHSDNSEITSGSTAGTGAGAGLATLTSDYFGPQYASGTNAGTTLYSSSKDVGFLGTVSGYDVDLIGMASNDGVIDGVLDEAAVTAAGTDMEVDIATGAFLVRGHPYRNTASAPVVIGANGTGNPRIDRVVIRHYPKGTAHEGHAEFAVLAGTAAASPSAPAVTQDGTVWEVPLARVAVAAGASSISNANLTDERPFVGPRSAGAVIEALLALKAPLASPTFTGTVTLPGTVVIPDGALAQADVSGLVAALAAKAALASPAFTGTINLNGITAIVTNGLSISQIELCELDGVTSNIQTQLNAKAPLANPTFTGTATAAAAHITGALELDGALNHDGTTVGFFGTAPATQAAAMSNITTNTAGVAYGAGEQAMLNNFKQFANEMKAIVERYGLAP